MLKNKILVSINKIVGGSNSIPMENPVNIVKSPIPMGDIRETIFEIWFENFLYTAIIRRLCNISTIAPIIITPPPSANRIDNGSGLPIPR